MGSTNMPNELNDDKNDPALVYLRRLSKAKKTINHYFLHGRAMRDLPDQPHLPSRSMLSQAWLSKDGSSLLIPLTSPKKTGSYDVDMTLNLKQYGFDATDASKSFSVSQIPAYKGQEVHQDSNIYPGDQVRISKTVNGRDVILLEIK